MLKVLTNDLWPTITMHGSQHTVSFKGLLSNSKKMKTQYYVITHNDVDGHHCLDFILKLVGEAKVVFKERNKNGYRK